MDARRDAIATPPSPAGDRAPAPRLSAWLDRLTWGALHEHWRALLLALLPVLYVVQNPTLQDYDQIAGGIKAYHVLLPLFVLSFPPRWNARQTVPLMVFFAACLTSSALGVASPSRLVNAFIFCMVCLSASRVSHEQDRWFRVGATVAVALQLLNMLAHATIILQSGADNGEGRPLYPTLQAGGLNIEVSVLVLLAVYCRGVTALPLVAALAMFAIFKTRAVLALLPVGLAARAWIATAGGGPALRLAHSKSMRIAAFALCVAGVTYLVFIGGDLVEEMTQRLMAFGEDPGSQGRLMLYAVAFQSSQCYELGCGVGSAESIIRSSGVADFFEDNFHNVYLQQLVETGVLGALSYLTLCGFAVLAARRSLEAARLLPAVLLLLVMNTLQFNGFEAISAFILGRVFFRDEPSDPDFHRLR